MNLSWIDWTIVVVSLILIRAVSWSTRSLMRGVADFLSANRLAGRYLLTISGEVGGFGVISMVAGFQAFTSAGFPTMWWGLMSAPLGIIFVMTGWVYYRLRETRALTVPQFFEMRYSRKFRILAGSLCWLSGIINFGIFPAVAARFLIYFCGLPETFAVMGLHIATYPVILAVDLGLALFFVNAGGQVSVMITECAQGIIASFAFFAIAVAVIIMIPWHTEVAALQLAPANASMLNPFHTSEVKDFNVWFYMIGIFISVYSFQSWLGTQGFMTSARTPHEQRMGSIIRVWRSMPQDLMRMVLPLAAFTALNSAQFAPQMAAVHETISHIGNKAVQNEMLVPVALAHILPVGIKGLLVMVAVFLSLTCHDTYMHSWGSIFVQDIVMPIRQKAFTPREHIAWLRWSIFGVAVFSFFFSLLYVESDKIFFFQAITGTIWLGGAGAVMIGGLYSRFGTTAGAYCAMVSGAVLGIAGLVIPKMWEAQHTTPFPINGQWLMLIASLISIALYVGVSIATGGAKRPFNLEKMLHRGAYSVDPPQPQAAKSALRGRWLEMLGVGKEFTKGDTALAILLTVWTLGWWLVFLVVCTMHFVFHAIPEAFWPAYWRVNIYILATICVPSLIWFTIGGALDMRALLTALKTAVRDPNDDGRVIHELDDRLDADPILEAAVK
ncbi:MAG: sodium:solute symporter [Capsulimonas sp.]|uniref:sodium:solute symporter family protein n=1 Tax=Capsulimonas sp. TaxID=2494211 RepID=UPI0032643C41